VRKAHLRNIYALDWMKLQ